MKNIFRNPALVLAVLACCGNAMATGSVFGGDTTNNYDNRTYGGQGGNGGQGGTGVGVGVGIAGAAAGVVGSGNSNVGVNSENKNTNTSSNINANNVSSRNENSVANVNSVKNSNSQGQGQDQSQRQSASSDQSQRQQNNSSNSVGATGSGNATDVSIKLGDVRYQEAAQAASAYAPTIPTVATSCRLYISLGGSGSSVSTTASASGGIPIGNDQTCLSGNALKMMSAINDADRRAGRGETFTQADFRSQICKIEGMAEMEGCKPKLSSGTKTASDEAKYENLMVNLSGNGGISDAMAAKVAAHQEFTDPFIRARLGLN